jgi:hypothetical protein
VVDFFQAFPVLDGAASVGCVLQPQKDVQGNSGSLFWREVEVCRQEIHFMPILHHRCAKKWVFLAEVLFYCFLRRLSIFFEMNQMTCNVLAVCAS